SIAVFTMSCSFASEHPEILFCIFERTGVLFDQPYGDPPQSVNCGNTTYCQKISANYIYALSRLSTGLESVQNEESVGCDGIDVPNVFNGPKCKKEGCYDIISNGEKYQQCCCKENDCNSSAHLTFFSLLLITLLRFLS
ncbi:hypothetical protein PMAYCL1PPCAC_32846, partial [Pristionchus mayeri]